jgi:hypothetical protein
MSASLTAATSWEIVSRESSVTPLVRVTRQQTRAASGISELAGVLLQPSRADRLVAAVGNQRLLSRCLGSKMSVTWLMLGVVRSQMGFIGSRATA